MLELGQNEQCVRLLQSLSESEAASGGLLDPAQPWSRWSRIDMATLAWRAASAYVPDSSFREKAKDRVREVASVLLSDMAEEAAVAAVAVASPSSEGAGASVVVVPRPWAEPLETLASAYLLLAVGGELGAKGLERLAEAASNAPPSAGRAAGNGGGVPENPSFLPRTRLGAATAAALAHVARGEAEPATKALAGMRTQLLCPWWMGFGGLESTRDLLDQTLTAQAVAAGVATVGQATRMDGLVRERLTRRPNSPQAWMLQADAWNLLGHDKAGYQSKLRAYDLGLGQRGFGAH